MGDARIRGAYAERKATPTRKQAQTAKIEGTYLTTRDEARFAAERANAHRSMDQIDARTRDAAHHTPADRLPLRRRNRKKGGAARRRKERRTELQRTEPPKGDGHGEK